MAEDRIQDIQRFVSKRLDALAQTAEHPQKAMLAKLRRGVGRAPGDLPELWGFFLEGQPGEWESRGGPPSREEWAVYLALTLYALHQQGRSTREEDGNMHKEGESLGRAIRKLLDPGEAPEDSSVLRRFNALATANGMPERVHYLRGIVQLLRAKGIPLDYAQLAVDLYLLQSPESAAHVRLHWGENFYFTQPEENAKEPDRNAQEKEN